MKKIKKTVILFLTITILFSSTNMFVFAEDTLENTNIDNTTTNTSENSTENTSENEETSEIDE